MSKALKSIFWHLSCKIMRKWNYSLTPLLNLLAILGAIKKFSGIEYSIIESKSEIKFANLTSLAVDISEAMRS
jgi:hypothetical protein